VLIRHAKSAWPAGMPDHDRPLGPRGRRDAPVAGRWLRLAGLLPDLVLCSTACRARETWQLASRELAADPPVRLEREVYEASPGQLLSLIRQLPAAASTVVVVGHDPAIPQVARTLTTSDAATRGPAATTTLGVTLDRLQEKFPTGAIAVLKVIGAWSGLRPGSAQLTAFVTPRLIQADNPRRQPGCHNRHPPVSRSWLAPVRAGPSTDCRATPTAGAQSAPPSRPCSPASHLADRASARSYRAKDRRCAAAGPAPGTAASFLTGVRAARATSAEPRLRSPWTHNHHPRHHGNRDCHRQLPRSGRAPSPAAKSR